jgi:hypothetical protein
MSRKTRLLIVTGASLSWLIWQLSHRRNELITSAAFLSFVDVATGDALCRPDHLPWNTFGAGAFVIVGAGGCPACSIVKPFEAEIEEYGRLHGIPTIYIVPEKGTSDRMANDLREAGKTVLRVRQEVIGVDVVPTFIRVADNGTIRNKWIGVVPDARHDEVFGALTAGARVFHYDVVPSAALSEYVANAKYQIVVLSEIGLSERARVIPALDLPIRAAYELDPSLPVIVDCGSAPSSFDCQKAVNSLAQMKFPQVLAAGLPRRPSACR